MSLLKLFSGKQAQAQTKGRARLVLGERRRPSDRALISTSIQQGMQDGFSQRRSDDAEA